MEEKKKELDLEELDQVAGGHPGRRRGRHALEIIEEELKKEKLQREDFLRRSREMQNIAAERVAEGDNNMKEAMAEQRKELGLD